MLGAREKRLDRGPLRVVRELVAAELHTLIGVVYGHEHDPEYFHGAALDWRSLSDPEIEAALKALVAEGFFPGDADEDD